MASPANTVIVGAGIIGISTAYYLSQSESCDPKTIHIIEPSLELFCSASGLAGGFLAEDCAPLYAPLDSMTLMLTLIQGLLPV